MKNTARKLFHVGGILLVAMAFIPIKAEASIVRFEGTLALLGNVDGFVICAVGSSCAQAFEADTGITPIRSEFAQGRLLFSYDTQNRSILAGSSFTISSIGDPDTATYDVIVGSMSVGGTDIVACYAGIQLTFGGTSVGAHGSTIGGRVNYCLPGGEPQQVVSLDDFVASGHNTFGGAAYVTPIGSQFWRLSTNGTTLSLIPAPSTFALVALGLLSVGARQRFAGSNASLRPHWR